ncbi:MAG: trypsin-like peptidase domain-containing protein [Candidatus Edwardsbacteria bacterium]
MRKNLLFTVLGSILGAIFGALLVCFLFSATGGLFGLNPIRHKYGGQVKRQLNQSLTYQGGRTASLSLIAETESITASRKNAIVLAAQKVGPAVVSINVIQTRIIRENPFFTPFGDEFFDNFWRDFFPPREYHQQIRSLGSGVLINPQGYILTNEHVVEDADVIKVTLPDGRQFDGKLIGADMPSDIAVVKIEGKNLPSAPLGNSDNLVVGEWAIAIGNPFAFLLEDTQPTVTIGVISATKRIIKPERGRVQVYREMIQTDAAINPGNSGGPLVNADGEVIGINTFIFTSSRGSEGIGFAIPINRAKKILEELVKHGEVKRVNLGIRVQEITPLLAESMNLKRKEGVVVSDIQSGSLAETNGIELGDVIFQCQKKRIGKIGDWEDIVSDLRYGEMFVISVERKGVEKEIRFKLEEVSPPKTAKLKTKLGLIVSDSKDGLIVSSVESRSLAERLGIQVGDLIQKVNNQTVKTSEEFNKIVQKIKPGQQLSLLLKREGTTIFLSFTV